MGCNNTLRREGTREPRRPIGRCGLSRQPQVCYVWTVAYVRLFEPVEGNSIKFFDTAHSVGFVLASHDVAVSVKRGRVCDCIQFFGSCYHLGDGVSLRHSMDFFDRCRVGVVPSKPAALLGVFIDDTAGGPVVAYLEVLNYEVPLVMSEVIQATGRRILHKWVWLHLMLTFAYSGQPLPTHCSTKFTTVLRGSGDFRVLATWRSDSALTRKVQKMLASGISSELRAHQMALGGVVAHSSPPAGVVAQVVRSLQSGFFV